MSSNDDLSRLLRSWQPDTDPGSGFNRAVWARIADTEARRWRGWESFLEWAGLFARPRIAITAAMAALFVGVFAGTLQARAEGQERYLRSLNPYQPYSAAR